MAHREQSTFSVRYSVSTSINAAPAEVWSALTDVERHNAWNSTVDELKGPIELGRRLAIKVPIAANRTFRPRVITFEPSTKMVWQDGTPGIFRGTRTFTLRPEGGGTLFSMTEELKGFAIPMARRSLPDFTPVFDQYAADLKGACET
jgi:hypothetical protein